MRMVLALALAFAVSIGAPAATSAPTRPRRPALIDCTCYDLYRIQPNGKARHLLSRGGSRNLFDVAVAQDEIAYIHNIAGPLFTSTLTGDAESPLGFGWVDDARFSPDGTQVVYAVRDNSLNGCYRDTLFVTDVDGTNPRTLIRNCGERGFSWSPDSTRIAFLKVTGPADPAPTLTVADADGTNQHDVTGKVLGLRQPAWSPSGDRIAYTGGRDPMVHIVRADASKDIAIARGTTPTWSPDGSRLEFVWQRGGGRGSIVATINRDGTGVRALDPLAAGGYGQGMSWSPDGRRILYRRQHVDSCACHMDLYLARPDGSHKQRVYTGVGNEEFGPLYWTPDGKRIVYTSFVQFGE